MSTEIAAPTLLGASLVYDGGDQITIPACLGQPRADQLVGTVAEQLVELSGRICYDSLGTGRGSMSQEGKEGYHEHIAKVNHGSVWEHYNFVVSIPLDFGVNDAACRRDALTRAAMYIGACANRPGCVATIWRDSNGGYPPAGTQVRISMNLRTAREWLPWSQELYGSVSLLDLQMDTMLRRIAGPLAPNILQRYRQEPPSYTVGDNDQDIAIAGDLLNALIVPPMLEHEKWVSLYMCGSRGFSHEQVRHGDFTAISQRSTRFVDEDGSPWVTHPLLERYIREETPVELMALLEQAQDTAQRAYRAIVAALQPWLAAQGVEATPARKQARGAARGHLGNALHTEMIFSASVPQWKRQLRQRCSDGADAEIRAVYIPVLKALRASRYADEFDDFALQPASDGTGQSLVPRPQAEVTPVLRSGWTE